MPRIIAPVALAVSILIAFSLPLRAADTAEVSAGRTYYVSSTSGNDTSDGTSPQRAWRSLARANAARFVPGDRLLFKAGDTFVGQLALQSSGTVTAPLRISRYGSGSAPLISGSGTVAAILLRNQQGIEIADLEITNDVRKAAPGAPREESYGIRVINDSGVALKHFRFARLNIHDIYAERISHASEAEFNRVVISAIRISASPAKGGRASSIDDIEVADNTISRTGRFGVQVTNSPPMDGDRDARARDPQREFNHNIVVQGNRFHETGGSGVMLAGAKSALIEDNDFVSTGSSVVPDRMVGRGSGAWVINCWDVVAQHNRSRHVRGYKDSYGMHVDFGNQNVLYQYNYSEDSEGGFVEILGDNRNITWRYNISVNDGLRERDGNTLWLSRWSKGMVPSDGIFIYNNTIYVKSGLSPDLGFRARGAHIWNNLFLTAPGAAIGKVFDVALAGGRLDLAGNLFRGDIAAGFTKLDRHPLFADPLLIQPGALSPAGYRLRAGSPAHGGGVAIVDPPFPAAGSGIFARITARPAVDFFGSSLPPHGPRGIGAVSNTADQH